MDERLNQQHLIDLLAEMDGVSKKDADIFVREFFHLIEDALEKDGVVKVKGLGTFKLVSVESRESVNINTGERFTIDGYNKISFTPDISLRELINKPFEHFEAVELNDGVEFNDIDTDDELLQETPLALDETELNSDDNIIADEEHSSEVEQTQPIIQGEDKADEVVTENHETVIDAVVAAVTNAEVLPIEEMSDNADESSPALLKHEDQQVELDKSVPIRHEQQNRLYKYLILVPIFVLIVCIGIISYLYFPELFELKSKDVLVEDKVIVVGKEAIEKASTESIIADSNLVLIADIDSPVIAVAAPVGSIPQKEPIKKTTEVGEDGTQPDSINYKIVGTKTTYTVKPGETLTRVALRFYGTKNLWPYIVKHNPNKIKNPNNVPSGTVLKIPEIIKK